MNDQRYYAVLSDELKGIKTQPKVLEFLGCYDFTYDALERFNLFYQQSACALYTYDTISADGELLGLLKIDDELPSFNKIMRAIIT